MVGPKCERRLIDFQFPRPLRFGHRPIEFGQNRPAECQARLILHLTYAPYRKICEPVSPAVEHFREPFHRVVVLQVSFGTTPDP